MGFDARGRLLVELPSSAVTVRARSLLRTDGALRRAVLDKRDALLIFENGDIHKPIVAGIIQPRPEGPAPDDVIPLRSVETPAIVVEADADGNRVKLVAREEIVLECGDASITLRRNGRVIIKGTHVDSLSAGTHRIRGGQIRLN